MKTEPTKRNLTEVISEMPEGTDAAQKNFLGFYDPDGKLVAILDLITDYPQVGSAFIGWFMVEAELQGQGIGSQIFADIRASLEAQGYTELALGVIKENEPAIEFWEKQGFVLTGEEKKQERYTSVKMKRAI